MVNRKYYSLVKKPGGAFSQGSCDKPSLGHASKSAFIATGSKAFSSTISGHPNRKFQPTQFTRALSTTVSRIGAAQLYLFFVY